jgi:hypothetical protein
MKTVHVQGYGATVNFPDGTPDNTIESVLKENFPETDEMLVARFDNPDTPASGLSREDFSRYKKAKPPTALSDLPSIVVDAAAMTAGLIARGLPEAVKTYANIFDLGTAARTFMEGAARGAYDTETLTKMANNYLRSKVESFGGTSENEEDDQYKRFLALKELQNVRSAIERGDRSAWNEYAEFAGVEGMKIDESRINTAAAELTGEIIDPTTFIPGTKVGAMAAKGATRAMSAPVRGLGKGLSRAADATRRVQDRVTSKIRGFEEAIDEGTGGLGKVAIPGGIGAAVASGTIGSGTATLGAGLVAAPTIMDVAGGLLTGFGEAMAHTPTRLGGLGRLASNMPDTVAGKLAGRIKWMDRPAEYAGRAAAGAGVGAGVGAGIGLVSGGLEGMAQGIGSGGVLGAAGGGFARTVEGLTGANLRKAQDSDFDRWVSKKDPEDRKRLSAIKDRKDRMIRMDAEEILLGAGAEVRHVGPDHEVNGRKLGEAQGYHDIEGGKNIVYLNTNADAGTMSHEVYHALARLDGFDMMNSSIKQLHQRLHSPEEINKFIQTYEKKLKNKILLSEGQIQKMGNSTEAKVDYILEELGAEYFRNTIEGKNSDYIFSGNSFAESLKGVFARFTKGKLDRVYDTFKSPILGEVKKTRLMDRMMSDLIKARRKAARDVEMSIDEPVRVYTAADLADDSKFREMEGMGIAKVDRKGKRVLMGETEQDRVAAERAATIAGVLDKVPDETGGMAKQPDGSYKGTRFSAGQLKALMDSPLINDTIKKAIREIQAIAEGDQYANVTYAAALMKTKKGLNRYRNLPVSNRDAIIYDLVISPSAGTITGRILDMSMTESRARRLYNQSGEMQKVFGSEAQLFKDLHSYINALTSGERRTAEVLGSQRKSDFLSKILAVRNVKGNPEIPDPASMSRSERKKAEGESNHPWRSFRLDRIVAMKQKQGRPVLSFSQSAYQRGQGHFSPEPVRPVEQHPENQPVQGRLTGEQKARIKELHDHYEEKTPERMKLLKSDAIDSFSSRLINDGIPVTLAKQMARRAFDKIYKMTSAAHQIVSGLGKNDMDRIAGDVVSQRETRKHVNPNWLTSAFESFENDIDLAMMKARQVGGAESGVRQVTADQGEAFVVGERLADTKAFGSSLRDDPASPPRVYASAVEGQKYGSAGNYNYFFEWKPDTPMVVSSHHHYGVANGVTGIHEGGQIGDKNARSFGDPDSESYDTLPSGKQVLDTHLLVGNKGAKIARAHQLIVSSPKSGFDEVRKAYKRGGASAATKAIDTMLVNQLVGGASQGKTRDYKTSEGIPPSTATQRSRTEAYVLDPDLSNVKRVTIVTNAKGKELSELKGKVRQAFKNNSSKLPPIKVVSRDSGPSGNRGRKAITDEHYKLTGQTRFSPARASESMPAFNVRNEKNSPFADMIVEGVKTIETRVKPTLNSLVGERVKLVRTTGKGSGDVIGEVTVGEPKFYATKEEFDADFDKHLVKDDSEFAFGEQGKYGYPMLDPVKYKEPYSVDSVRDRPKGHVTTRDMPGPRFSPERMDAEHAKAIDSGDTETARKLVDDAAREAGFDSPKVYHGTNSGRFETFQASQGKPSLLGLPFYFVDNIKDAKRFGDRVVSAYLKVGENPPKNKIELASRPDSTAVVAKNLPGTSMDATTYAVKDPNQIKSAELATYDDNGNLIPLSQRFNKQSDDIRFSPQRELNKRGGAIYTTEQGHKAIQTSSRAGVRVYDQSGKRVGPVFVSIERAERYLAKQ